MTGFNALLLFSSLAIGAFANSPYYSRQFFDNHVYLPRCRFDEHILRNSEKFDKEIHKSDFVFTGKVSNSDIIYKDNAIIFSVLVRRYFKNSLKFSKTKEVRVLKTINEGEGVKCRQPIRPKFTAIFIGRKLKNSKDADIVLGIGPVPVTLYNLDRVSEATKETSRAPEKSPKRKRLSSDRRRPNVQVKALTSSEVSEKYNILLDIRLDVANFAKKQLEQAIKNEQEKHEKEMALMDLKLLVERERLNKIKRSDF